jgi:hypothetical protein
MDANGLRMSAAYVWLRLCAWLRKLLAKTPAQAWQAQIKQRKLRHNNNKQKRGIRTRDSPS